MKISDNELVRSIFIEILKSLPRASTMNYVCGMKGVVKDSEFWRNSSLSLHINERKRITSKITSSHLLNRIKNLAKLNAEHKNKLITTYPSDRSYPLTFTLDDPRLLDAFDFSRDFWIKNGVNEKPVKVDNFEILCDELRALLLEKFAGVKS